MSAASSASAAAAGALQTTPSAADVVPTLVGSSSKTNPVSALIEGLRQVIVAVVRLTAELVRFSSVTLPSTLYSVLHYSVTLQVNFPALALLFLALLVATFVWFRYRHLNRYERLREVPLTKDEGFNLHPDVSGTTDDGQRGNGFHNYLDEFLQAIRIFGFLEKPVFHELARHLQTRRLIAGDTLSLDSDFSFYIVIDGKVQVFAPTPEGPGGVQAASSGFDDEEHNNGYQLLNEVESGGTLSSLFTILSLFTEDVRLDHAGPEPEPSVNMSHQHHEAASATTAEGLRRRHMAAAANSSSSSSSNGNSNTHRSVRSDDLAHLAAAMPPGGSQLQLNAAALRNVPSAMSSAGAVERLDLSAGQTTRRTRQSDDTDETATLHEANMFDAARSAVLRDVSPAPDLLPPAQAAAPFSHFAPVSGPNTPSGNSNSSANVRSSGPPSASFSPPLYPMRGRTYSTDRPNTPGSVFSGLTSGGGGPEAHGRPSDTMHHEGVGTIARAVTDTTLAVIPAEAFKRLTKRYPNAAAHIVQVILTRLSRVTFHTAHKYLGLTKEVMRTEKHLNEQACFQLPPAFYEQGGMERLRQRFLPEPSKMNSSAAEAAPAPTPVVDDYFRDASAYRRQGSSSSNKGRNSSDSSSPEMRKRSMGSSASPVALPLKTPWGHPDPPLRTPTSRTSVGPGDLLSMTGTEDGGRSNYDGGLSYLVSTPRPRSKGPAAVAAAARLEEPSTWKTSDRMTSPAGRNSDTGGSEGGATIGGGGDGGAAGLGSGALADFDLKDAVMSCIARSMGLSQAAPNDSPLASVSASPFLNPADTLLQRSVFKSAFSSLSMLDAAMAYDDQSSVTGGSSFFGAHHAELENEVEVRFFPAGSILARAGESAAGLFYVIDGFLDVVVPPEVDEQNTAGGRNATEKPKNAQPKAPRADASPERPHAPSRSGTARPEGPTSGARRKPSSASTVLDGSNGSSNARPNSATSAPKASAHVGNALDGTHNANATPRPAVRPIPKRAPAPPPPLLPTDLGEEPTQGPRAIYTIGRGGIAGYLSSLLGAASYVDIRAKTDTYVGVLPARALERVMERRPIVLLTLCKRLLGLLSPLILHIDSALDWKEVGAGQVIYREGDPSDSFYIVINGRLRAITEKGGGGVDVISEYGQGDSVGELDVITRSARRKTLHAIRDSELAKMPMTLFNAISVRHPAITIQISRIIARRVRDEISLRQPQSSSMLRAPPVPGLPDLGRNNLNLKTVVILPVTRQVPITDFANRLQLAFDDTIGGATAFLNQSSVMGVLGRHAFSRMGKLKLAGWLAEQEQRFRLVVYVVDTAVSSPWVQTSIKQADCVLLVGFGDDPSVGEYERSLLGVKTTARKELVLLHPERSVPPGTTRAWLKDRPWIHAHHHVELPGITRSQPSPVSFDPKAVKALRNLKAKLETSLQRYKGKSGAPVVGRPHHSSDYARLARRLCGKSIGLILGGGGARGCAHVGFLQALEERGIPIDMVGGTSIGSLVGGLYAREAEVVTTFGRAKKFSGRMASLWRFASDLTYPVVSYTTGHEFNRGVFKALSDTHIEDMWLPFFCNTTNITWSRMEVHTTGYAWRYIRGSMTLAGLIPPLVDDGHMLVDGGYMDNLPVSVMMAMGARDVFAVDVGSIDDTSPRSYGDTLSGWYVLLNKWNPWSDARNIPGITDIQGRLTYVSSVKQLEDAKNTPGCLYCKPAVEGFGTMQFASFNEISKIGYEAAKKALAEWEAEGVLPLGYEVESPSRSKKMGQRARRNSV